jgi:hypothetical protein
VLALLVAGIAAWGFQHRPKADPYRNGSTHEVILTCDTADVPASNCHIEFGADDLGGWIGEVQTPIPSEWSGRTVPGVLTIHHNWGDYDGQPASATFSAEGHEVDLGGKNDGRHFFN